MRFATKTWPECTAIVRAVKLPPLEDLRVRRVWESTGSPRKVIEHETRCNVFPRTALGWEYDSKWDFSSTCQLQNGEYAPCATANAFNRFDSTARTMILLPCVWDTHTHMYTNTRIHRTGSLIDISTNSISNSFFFGFLFFGLQNPTHRHSDELSSVKEIFFHSFARCGGDFFLLLLFVHIYELVARYWQFYISCKANGTNPGRRTLGATVHGGRLEGRS